MEHRHKHKSKHSPVNTISLDRWWKKGRKEKRKEKVCYYMSLEDMNQCDHKSGWQCVSLSRFSLSSQLHLKTMATCADRFCHLYKEQQQNLLLPLSLLAFFYWLNEKIFLQSVPNTEIMYKVFYITYFIGLQKTILKIQKSFCHTVTNIWKIYIKTPTIVHRYFPILFSVHSTVSCRFLNTAEGIYVDTFAAPRQAYKMVLAACQASR